MPDIAKKCAVLLTNLGGPENLEAVESFLFDLFMDRDIIPIPLEGRLREPLARFLARRRYQKVRQRYQVIGQGSPLVKITNEQARALGESLRKSDLPVPVFSAMRYGHPQISKIIKRLPETLQDLIVIPLFPHYCKATTGTTIKCLQQAVQRHSRTFRTRVIEHFHEHPLFLEAMLETMRLGIQFLQDKIDELPFIVFCAHSVPLRFVKQGDPYIDHIEQNARRLASLLNLPEGQWQVAYQSQIGPIKWVGPRAEDVLERLGRDEQNGVLLVPISFVSDHLETLYDMDIVLREVAKKAGIRWFHRVECFNTRPVFITFLNHLVRTELQALFEQRSEDRSQRSEL
ncbi:ferrochelatase [candidate division CSSED10-310 bacterium]|uniref:Ferrochelatase n=1 Tax=candidate division CSSED10-310 bacterium TaxID=2855610 RepID=A0ABV6YTR3_UNCC1